MTWAPVSKEAFQRILAEEVHSLPPDALRIFERYAVPVFSHHCDRNNKHYGVEQVFVVARAENRLLFFDDVEEEFGVAAPDADGILRTWGTYGPLVAAVLGLQREVEAET